MKFDTIYDGLIKGTEKLALVGLGYVGMPIAVEFAKHIFVIGFDIGVLFVRIVAWQCGIILAVDPRHMVGLEHRRAGMPLKKLHRQLQ